MEGERRPFRYCRALAIVHAGSFGNDTIKADAAIHDTSLAWPWQAVASVKVAVHDATRPAELLMIHHYWSNNL